MCRTTHSVISSVLCAIQMLVRIFMTILLMIENLVRMILQTIFNLLSFLLQMVSLIPLCVIFLLTTRLKCFMCGGGGPCPVNRGGACDCLMSLFAIIILFLIFRATGVLDKIFFSIGYAKATSHIARFVPRTGDITECSRNDTDTEYIFYPIETTTAYYDEDSTVEELISTLKVLRFTANNMNTTEDTTSLDDYDTVTVSSTIVTSIFLSTTSQRSQLPTNSTRRLRFGQHKLVPKEDTNYVIQGYVEDYEDISPEYKPRPTILIKGLRKSLKIITQIDD